ncbi:MAG: EVE domain-containing protein [Candidatus Caldarchaeum sp.]|nr:EVE domain-containing protein [Candidatus Caldarchaeum sp.]
MAKYWIACGTPEHWQIAFAMGKIWGLVDKPKMFKRWEKIQEGDKILIYATRPVQGVVGYGTILRKFKQDRPLWPPEVQKNKVIWPYRFEFDVGYVLPQEKWVESKVVTKYIIDVAPASFQVLNKHDEVKKVIELLEQNKSPQPPETETSPNLHDQTKAMLLEIGRMQGFISETEFDMDGSRLDVVWRRVERSVPTYVFEIQVGGDLYHALSKLKHARDIWNSRIYLIVVQEDTTKAEALLHGTFHEIRNEIKVIEISRISELYRKKKDYKELENALGL